MQKAGGCLCGAVRFTCELVDGRLVACHCGRCRRLTSSHWLAAQARPETLFFEREGGLVWRAGVPGVERGDCGRCGAHLFRRAAGEETVAVTAGAIDDPSGLALAAHIFVSEAAPYERFLDNAPRYARFRNEPPLHPGGSHAGA